MRSKLLIAQNISAFLILSLVMPLFVFAGSETASTPAKALTEDQKIIHVLNRLGYGARPGDVDRVRAIGLKKYIEQQIDAVSIDDSAAEARVRGLDVFGMTTAEVFAKYPNPGALLRALQEDGMNRRQQPAAGQPNEMTRDEQRERRMKLAELYRKYDLKPAGQLIPQITANRVLRAVYSERQLQEVMVDFWQNHFNVFAGKAAVRWYIPSYERDVLRTHALGNFKDLVVGTAQHPAMLFYLDNFESVAPQTQNANNRRRNNRLEEAVRSGNIPPRLREQIKRRQGITDPELDQRIERLRANGGNLQQRMQRGLNENYARELMELHTLGVDGGYTQQDIVELARALTGWTINDARGYRRSAAGMINGTEDRRLERLQRIAGIPDDVESGEFYFNARWHDNGPKTILGQKIDEGGIKDGLKAIDILVSHPSTSKFIARKLAVKFVSDTPSQALVDRIAAAFRSSKGDIRTTLKALFNDEEFFATANYRAKIKTPFELAVSSIRAIGADTNASPALVAMLNKLGEIPYGYQAPTGYPDTAEDWVNTGALLERLNFAVAIASNRIPGTRADLKKFAAADRTKTLSHAVDSILDGDISQATLSTIKKQLEQPLPEVAEGSDPEYESAEVPNLRPDGQPGGRMNRNARLLAPSGDPDVFKVVSLVLGSPEFQRQ